MLQCVAVCCSEWPRLMLKCVLQCVAVSCSMLQCVAVCCSEWPRLMLRGNIRNRYTQLQLPHFVVYSLVEFVTHHHVNMLEFVTHHHVCVGNMYTQLQLQLLRTATHIRIDGGAQCNTLQLSATHCNTIHTTATATHCSCKMLQLQHSATATHCK